ncbi:Hypothetical predicted protein [Paramuricea clavata]|uniref:Uncharacterized protein n=1 Tax=Paramuricea clavata TaxID=317549 RepID=A0A7D9HDE0_PARCT|nr:Hypothetical predicted protein [Paramuricea clavata]
MGDRKDLMNEAYDAGILTLGAVAVSVVSKKFAGDSLGDTSNPKRIMKLAMAVGVGALGVHYLQTKKIVPDEIHSIKPKLNHGGYEDEMKRHNKALEKLAKAKEKWYERQVEKKTQNSNTQTGTS